MRASLTLTYRPLPPVWPSGERTPTMKRRSPNFRATWYVTIEELTRELNQLGARTAVIEAGFRESDIRNDGLPRANAHPTDPAVIVSFESSYGPLRYGCDSFTTYPANLRAIALALEALRLVDRYGVTKKGEQYTGWLALPETTLSRQAATEFLYDNAHGAASASARLGGALDIQAAYREAAMKLHPDKGGSREDWDKLQSAKAVLGL